MKRLLGVILFLGLLMVIIQLALPGKLATAVEISIQEQWEIQNVQVKIYAFPAIKILAGNIDRAEIFIGSTTFGMLPINELYIELEEVSINIMNALRRNFNYELQRVAGTFEFRVTEQGLNYYLKNNPISVLGNNVTVELRDDLSIVRSQLSLLGSSINIALLGRFTLKSGNIAFLIEDLKIDDHSLDGLLGDRFQIGTNFEIVIGTLPYNAVLHSLKTGENTIIFYGTIGANTP